MSSNVKSDLAQHRPQGFQGRGDKYLGDIARELRRMLWKTQQRFTDPTCQLTDFEWSDLAVVLVEWAEDMHNDLGLWRAVEAYQQQFFGTPLPLIVSAEPKVELLKFDPRRIQYLLWVLWPWFNFESVLSPAHADLAKLAEAASQFLTERFARLPQDSGIKRFLATPNEYAWHIKLKLLWLGCKSYLFRYLFYEYLKDEDEEAGSPVVDEFICQHCTWWSGLGVIDVLAGTLDLTQAERETLRTWHARHTSFYRVLAWEEEAGEVKRITARNIVNGQTYTVRMNTYVEDCSFKPGMAVFGSLVPWRGEWYWSGEQKAWETIPESDEPKLRQDMLERSSQIAYRFCPAEAARAKELVGQLRTKFISRYGSDLKAFPDGLALAAAEQRRLGTEWAAADPEKVAQTVQAHGLPHSRPSMTFPQEVLDHNQGVAAFFNPEQGVEYLLDYNHVRSGLGKKGVGLSEAELEALRDLIFNETVSVAFVRRLVADHGADSIMEAFRLRDWPSDLALEVLLRRYKGHFYRQRYPAISISERIPPQQP